jgi:hypothetical protein
MKSMKKVQLIFVFCMATIFTLGAQGLVMKGLDSITTILHIQYEPPKGFKDLNVVQRWRAGNSPGYTFCGVFESGDGQCKVLYNLLPTYPGRARYTHRDIIRFDYKSNYGLRILPTKEAQKWFNADSIFLYDIPSGIPTEFEVDEKFTHCTKMVITKQYRPDLFFIWYFTDKGKKKEEKYVQKINKHIWYSDGNLDYNSSQRWEEWMKKYFVEVMKFMTKHDAEPEGIL